MCQIPYPITFCFSSFRKPRLRMVTSSPNPRLGLRSPPEVSNCDSCDNFPTYNTNKGDREGKTPDTSLFSLSQPGQRDFGTLGWGWCASRTTERKVLSRNEVGLTRSWVSRISGTLRWCGGAQTS